MWKWQILNAKVPRLPEDYRATHDVCSACSGTGKGDERATSITILSYEFGLVLSNLCSECGGTGYVKRPS
jgi:DnaJ-class molecular chaperone